MKGLKNYSRAVGTESVQVYPGLHAMASPGNPESTGGLSHLRIWNVSETTVWLSRSGEAAVRKPGSYPLGPGEREEFAAATIPLGPLSAVAEAGEAALTVELRHVPKVFTLGDAPR